MIVGVNKYRLEEEDENLDILDIESAVMTGTIYRVETGDVRGDRYVIRGVAADNMTPVGVVGRFSGETRYVIITVYEVTPKDR